jgi:hypothetical protein
MRRLSTTLAFAGVALLALSACSGGTAASPGASTAASGSPAASAPADTPTPSVAVASPSTDGSAFPSLAIPSFAFPSEDKELEALLPSTMCGADTVKFSMSGATFEASADPEFRAILDELGKTPNDVSLAIAGGMTADGCGAGIFRIKGADANRFKDVFLSEAAKEGTTYQEKSVAGKSVLVGDGTEFQYAYFKGDALLFVTAPDETKAIEILQALP